jgi:quinol monooxygenase YgiN
MFCVNVWLTVKDPKDVPKVAELLTQISRTTIHEDACERIEVYHSASDETKFLLCEHWDSEAGWKGHRDERIFIDVYLAQVLPLVDREPHICTLLE